MSASITLQKSFKVSETGEQDLDFAVDAGAYRYVAGRLRVDGSSATSGNLTVMLQHALINDVSEYKTLITFTNVAWNASFPSVEISTSEQFGRYLRWVVVAVPSGGETKFSIELILKA